MTKVVEKWEKCDFQEGRKVHNFPFDNIVL